MSTVILFRNEESFVDGVVTVNITKRFTTTEFLQRSASAKELIRSYLRHVAERANVYTWGSPIEDSIDPASIYKLFFNHCDSYIIHENAALRRELQRTCVNCVCVCAHTTTSTVQIARYDLLDRKRRLRIFEKFEMIDGRAGNYWQRLVAIASLAALLAEYYAYETSHMNMIEQLANADIDSEGNIKKLSSEQRLKTYAQLDTINSAMEHYLHRKQTPVVSETQAPIGSERASGMNAVAIAKKLKKPVHKVRESILKKTLLENIPEITKEPEGAVREAAQSLPNHRVESPASPLADKPPNDPPNDAAMSGEAILRMATSEIEPPRRVALLSVPPAIPQSLETSRADEELREITTPPTSNDSSSSSSSDEEGEIEDTPKNSGVDYCDERQESRSKTKEFFPMES